ncbi:MAG: sel1 repeat family protein [Chitinophagaceae bacterium]|nr:sel1 repeat family protein [Chitinophagaceae bacterium]
MNFYIFNQHLSRLDVLQIPPQTQMLNRYAQFKDRQMRPYILTFLFLLTSIFSFGQDKNYEKGLKAFDSKDYTKAYKFLKPFAESGNSMAEFVIGFCYLNPESNIKNDSLAETYLIRSAEKYNSKAMGLLSIYYFQKGIENEKFKIQALVWAEIAGAYDPAFNATTTRYLIRQYLNEAQLKEAETILKEKKTRFDKISIDAFNHLNKQAKSSNENSEKAKIPENKYNLIENPYSDWVYRWKLERFECDSMYYTAQVETKLLDSAINAIRMNQSFDIHFLYRGDNTKKFTISKDEQDYLIQELELLKNFRWEQNIFPYSRRLEQSDIQPTFDKTENLPTEKEKNMCSIVYTFSTPIFIRNGTMALYLDQKRYRTNYTQLEFGFYILENNRWEQIATVYKYYESSKR